MKKALSLILAIIMLMTASTFVGSAYDDYGGVCNCPDHKENNYCQCCLYCENLDTSYILECCVKTTKNGKIVWEKCCSICNGLEDCECTDCECCAEKSDEIVNEGSTSIIPPSVQVSLVEGFQNAMNKVRKIFDDFFDKIFEFLRIEDFFG